MNRLAKILLALVVILVVALVGLNFAIKAYLTPQRVKAMVIPPAEKALQRKVSLDQIKVSLFKGVTLTNLG